MLKLQSQSFEWALHHIEKFGDTDIFPLPFEFSAIREYWEEVRTYLSQQNILDWELRPFRRMLTPKNKYGFRISTQLDPLDSIVFTALIYEIGNELEDFRIPKDLDISFSNRFDPKPSGDMYDSSYNWEAFHNYCRKLSESELYEYVVVADIADFFPRIYSHPLEQALGEATNKRNHIIALKKWLKQLNGSVSYGIPVGQASSRLLAEVVLDDVDSGLMADGFIHCRFVDDFRIFCKTEQEALKALANLANLLFENHGLTLQQHKTKVMKIDNFQYYYLDNPYDDFSSELPEEEKTDGTKREEIEETLNNLLEYNDEIDIARVKYYLKKLIQFSSPKSVDPLLENLNKLYPVVKEVMIFFQNTAIESEKKHQVGLALLDFCTDSIVGHLEYNRIWILNLFTKNNEWNNTDKFIKLYSELNDQYSQRELILAMGRAGLDHWFRTKRKKRAGIDALG